MLTSAFFTPKKSPVCENGTEPVVRVMVEAESNEICQKYVDDIVKVIEEKGHVE